MRLTYSTLGRWEFYGEVINLLGTRNYLQTFDVPSVTGPEAFVTTNNIYKKFERFPAFGVRFTF